MWRDLLSRDLPGEWYQKVLTENVGVGWRDLVYPVKSRQEWQSARNYISCRHVTFFPGCGGNLRESIDPFAAFALL